MKKSLLFISTLLAAGTMSAFAEDSTTVNGLTYTDVDGVRTYTGNATDYVQINSGLSTAISKVVLDSVGIDTTGGNANGAWFTSEAISQAFDLQGTGIVIKGGSSGMGYACFNGTITGVVGSSFTWNDDTDDDGLPIGNIQNFVFTGDVSGFYGDFVRTTAYYKESVGGTGATNAPVGAIQFGKATADTAPTNTNISGTGSITTSSVLRYNYSGAAGSDSTAALVIGNSSITARYLTLRGGANYEITNSVTGYLDTISENTLHIIEGTTTFNGSVSKFGNVIVAGTLELGSTGTLDLSDAKVTLSNAIQNSGEVTVSTGTVFELGNLTADASGVYTLFTGTLTETNLVNWTTLDKANVTLNNLALTTKSTVSFSELGKVSVTVGKIVWNGSDGASWNLTDTNWTYNSASVAFEANDSVQFASAATVTVGTSITAQEVDVDANTTLNIGGNAINFAKTVIAENTTLTLASDNQCKSNNTNVAHTLNATGTGTVAVSYSGTWTGTSLSKYGTHDFMLDLGAGFTGTLEWCGNFNPGLLSNCNSNVTLVLKSQYEGDTAVSSVWSANATTIAFATQIDKDFSLAQNETFSGSFGGKTGTVDVFDAKSYTLTLSGTVNSITLKGTGTINISGEVASGKEVVYSGTGTLNLSGAQKMKGTLTVNSGTVSFANNDQVNWGTAVTINLYGGKIDFGSHRQSIASGSVFNLYGGTMTGEGDGNGAIDVIGGTATFNILGNSTINAAVAGRGVTVKFDVAKDIVLTMGTDSVLRPANNGSPTFQFTGSGTTNFSGSVVNNDNNNQKVTISLLTGTLNLLSSFELKDTASTKGLYNEMGTLNIGDGKTTNTVTTARIQLGNIKNTSSASKLNVNSGSTLVVTGNSNSTSRGYYNTNSFQLATWGNNSEVEVAGTILAQNADIMVGGNGNNDDPTLYTTAFTIKDGGVVAAKGIGQTSTSDSKNGLTLTLESGSKLILGEDGVGAKTSSNISVGKATIGMYSDTTTIATLADNSLVLTGTDSTAGTTFDTQKYEFNTAGTAISQGTAGGTMTVSTKVTGTGNLIKAGVGELILSAANDYEGGTKITAGTLTANDASALGAGTVTIDGGQLQIGDSSAVALNVSAMEIVLTSYAGTGVTAAIGGNADSSLTLSSGEKISLSIVTRSAIEGQYTIVDSVLASAFDIDSFALSDALASSYEIADYNNATGVLTIRAIPEPSMFGLLAGTLALALAGTRRRRKSVKG